MGYNRSPRTTNELRQLQVAHEFGVHVRPKRARISSGGGKRTGLPTTWSDINRSMERCWKRNKKYRFGAPRVKLMDVLDQESAADA